MTTTQLPLKPTTDWDRLIAKLEQDLHDLERDNTELHRERRLLSLAVTQGDTAAEAQARRLELTGCETDLRIRTLTEALEQAREHQTNERQREEQEQRRLQGVALLRAAERRRTCSEKLDQALSTMAATIKDWLDAADEIHDCGGHSLRAQHRGMLAGAIWHHLNQAGMNRSPGWQYRALQDVFSGESRPSPGRCHTLTADERVADEATTLAKLWGV